MSAGQRQVAVAVVIPYFQRDRGILKRALESVAAQDVRAKVRIIIVDDSSPLPASEAIDGFSSPGIEITVLRQPNGGPGAARNLALDNLPAGTDFVAFLDSDDVWRSDHLSNALDALGEDFGLYFSNHTRFDLEGDWFAAHQPIGAWLDAEQRRSLPVREVSAGRLEFDRGYLLARMVETYVCQTSTVVYRSKGNNVRFDPTLRAAGEDQLMFLQLTNTNRTVVGLSTDVHCGNGVNVYYGAFSWRDAKSVDRYGSILLFLNALTHQDFLSSSDRRRVRGQWRKFARAYSYLFIRALMMRTKPSLNLLGKILRKSPATVALMPLRLLAVLPFRKVEAQSW